VKIGIDVRKINDYGIGAHIRNVVLAAAIAEPRHRYVLYYDPSNTLVKNPAFEWVPERAGKYSVLEHFSLAEKAQRSGVSFFHSPHYTLPLALSCRSLITVHDLIHLKYKEYFPWWKVQAARLLIKKATAKADVIVTVSETTKQDLLDWIPSLEERIEVIYNRLSDEWFQPEQTVDLENLGIQEPYLLYAGNFKKHKGIDTLIRAYRNGRDLPSLVLVGKGNEMDHDLGEKILTTPGARLLGFSGMNCLRKIYSRALLFVFPSLYEGFGYPPLEAMACGAPVLCGDAPALKEVLGGAAEFFERGNAEHLLEKLKELISDSKKRETMSVEGRRRARLFATNEAPQKLIKIYERFS